MRYNLQFFAGNDAGEKTEEPTSKKLGKAREEGQVAKSQDLNTAVMLLVLFYSVQIFGGFMLNSFEEIIKFTADKIPELAKEEFTIGISGSIVGYNLLQIVLISLPIFAFAIFAAIIVNIVQVKWKPTLKPLKPKFSGMNPISGAKKLFSKDKIFDLLKTIVKLGFLFYVIYNALNDQWGLITNIYDLDFNRAVSLLVATILDLAIQISIVFFIIALVDYFYQKRKFKKDMKMTKQEVKDEYKQTEGNPEIKGQIRRKMQEASRRRMMQKLPEADVVITNPTHLAVAIQYDKKESEAPVVIAKGADYLAQRIKEIANENKIEIVENKPVARMLYHNVELGEQIPPELYQTVAEILAYVYGIKGRL
ncbi:MAG: flagellar biosynthesis protein FlhB [Lachnoclostridium sp.]|jgi:flagellar biosynthetic protein FlhB|nr:flagellar biosynthesis protein FlhB [Lachnoclostridium sp.]